jgi:hypothetical protein
MATEVPPLPGTRTGRSLLQVQVPPYVFHPVLMTLEKFGLVVRGVLYALVGVVALAAAFGIRETVDLQGSVALVEANSLKVPIGVIAAIGLAGYALWGVVRAVADPLERGTGWHGIVSRVGFLWSATAYTGLAVFALQFALVGASTGEGGLPFGLHRLMPAAVTPWLLALFGVVVAITGLGQFIDAWIAPFKSDFLLQKELPRMWHAWTWLGRIGLFARGIAFSTIGILMILGGFRGDVQWNYGLTRAFAALIGVPVGISLLIAVAIGFVALGLQSVTSPPVLRMKPGLQPPVRTRVSKET